MTPLRRRLSVLFVAILLALFRAADPAFGQDKFKIALWGDSRENLDHACEQIADVLLNKITDWDIQVHTGDFTHHGAREDWERTLGFKGVRQLFQKGRILLSTSNHDAEDPADRAIWDEYTKGVLPTNPVDHSTHFYGFRRGNVRIAVCDSYFTDSLTMQNWLDDFLKDARPSDWLIGVWHNVSYGDLTYKETYLPKCGEWIRSLQRHGGDFILNGHAHVYVRTKPLAPDGTLDEKSGLVTIINGTGGASWKEPVTPREKIAYTPSERSFPTITFLTFSGDSANVRTVDVRPESNLKVIDEWGWKR